MAEETRYTTESNRLLKEMNGKLDDLTKKVSEIQVSSENARRENDISKEDKLQEETLPENYIMYTCPSLEDIIKNFAEFRYEEERRALVSSVCSPSTKNLSETTSESNKVALFKFDRAASDTAFCNDSGPTPSILTKKVRNLKSHLIAHLRSKGHNQALDKITSEERELDRNDYREHAVGKRIGRLCYYMFKLERPDTDFEPLIYLHSEIIQMLVI
eukprot:Seg12853.1 transcript_id=Seg12853.1/GoldUCD/mRNA.D3Y31 product="hypothetical protein" protein_id=Seg12853.1/GoldUCD/D3Y31